MLKKIFLFPIMLLLIFGLFFNFVGNANAAEAIRIFINEKETLIISDSYIYKGRLLVPARFLAQALGADVEWNKDKKAVMISQNFDSGDSFLQGKNHSAESAGISNNLISAESLKAILDDDDDNDIVDYREGLSGGDKIENDPLVIDVRMKADYDAAHIPGALWIAPAADLAKAKNVIKIKSFLQEHIAKGGNEEIVVYCYTGNTSGLVAGVLGTKGYPIKNMMYGFDVGWRGTKYAPRAIRAPVENIAGEKVKCGG
jgi:rhodanese-related sulfurtransferase